MREAIQPPEVEPPARSDDARRVAAQSHTAVERWENEGGAGVPTESDEIRPRPRLQTHADAVAARARDHLRRPLG